MLNKPVTIREEDYGDEGNPHGRIVRRIIIGASVGDDGSEPEDDVVVWSSSNTTGVVAGNAANVLRGKD